MHIGGKIFWLEVKKSEIYFGYLRLLVLGKLQKRLSTQHIFTRILSCMKRNIIKNVITQICQDKTLNSVVSKLWYPKQNIVSIQELDFAR